MGKRGPLPKKDELKALSGSLPITKAVAQKLLTDPELPKPPKHFQKDEKKIWKLTVNLLKDLRVLEKIDQAVLAAYCDAYVKWQKAESELRKLESVSTNSMFISTGAEGQETINPLITISRRMREDMVRFAAQMGMTPAARIRIQIVPSETKKNPFSALQDQPTDE